MPATPSPMAAVPNLRLMLPDLEATHRLGRMLGERARAGDVLLLEGDLGAGKTSLAQGLARGLGIEGRVASPTFALQHDYAGRLPFSHLDLYRLGPGEAEAVGLPEVWEEGRSVVAIEWPDRLRHLPPDHLHVHLSHAGDAREATLTVHGAMGHLVEGLAP